MKKIIFPTCHGVELSLKDGYADKFNDAVMSNISAIYRPYIIPYSFNWNVLVSERQERTYQIESNLGLSKLRKDVVEIACDLLWYRNTKGSVQGMDVFQKIHAKLECELDILIGREGPESTIVLHGHSLGSQIVLDHCFESKYRIGGIFTSGSPISKYSGQFPDWGHLPDKGLDFWVNFWANRDLVCSTFSNHPSEQFRNFIEDVEVKTWNPFKMMVFPQHLLYWDSPIVHKKVADKLTNYLLKINEK